MVLRDTGRAGNTGVKLRENLEGTNGKKRNSLERFEGRSSYIGNVN